MRLGHLVWLMAILSTIGCSRDRVLLETENDTFAVKIISRKAPLWLPEGYDIMAEIEEKGISDNKSFRFDHVDLSSDFLNHFTLWAWVDQKTICFFSDNYRESIPEVKIILLNPKKNDLSLVSIETTPLQYLRIETESIDEMEFEIPVDIERPNWIRILVIGSHFDYQIDKSFVIRATELDVPIVVEVNADGLFLTNDHTGGN